VKIPAGTANGRTLRVRDRGIEKKDGTRGDLLVTVEVVVPKGLTDEAKQALEAYAATESENPRAHLESMVIRDE
jgi:molecular chaperone DnaJ